MVCIRCKIVVKDELTKLGLQYKTVELGEAEIVENITDTLFPALNVIVIFWIVICFQYVTICSFLKVNQATSFKNAAET